MCEFALFVDSDMAFDGSVKRGTGALVGAGANGEDLHEGPCDMFTLKWDHNIPGGLPNWAQMRGGRVMPALGMESALPHMRDLAGIGQGFPPEARARMLQRLQALQGMPG
jgi:hypothetical protein